MLDTGSSVICKIVLTLIMAFGGRGGEVSAER